MILTTVVFIAKNMCNSIRSVRLLKLLILLICSLISVLAFSQNQLNQQTAFTLAKSGSNTVVLYKLNSSTNRWKAVGNTEVYHIKSLAIDSKNEIIYAVNGGNLGTLHPNTGKFSLIGEIGSGSGEQGFININNVYALAFDANRNILYATHRMNGFDVLLKINPQSGKIIKGNMVSANGRRVDYKTIEISTFYFGRLYDSRSIVDLAYDNERKILYVIHNYFSTLNGINGYINIDQRQPEEYYRVSPIQKLAGVALNQDRKLFLSFTDNQISTGSPISGGGLTLNLGPLNTIDPQASRGTFFYGLDFHTSISCGNRLQLNGGLITDLPKKASQTIESGALIDIDAIFIAGQSIILNNNFEVKESVNFEARIDRNACR